MSKPRPVGPNPLTYELQRALAGVTSAVDHLDAALPLSEEPERGALQWLRADLGASLKRLTHISLYPRG